MYSWLNDYLKPNLVKMLNETGSIIRGPRTLKSGKATDWYVDLRRALHTPKGLALVSLGIVDFLSTIPVRDSIGVIEGPASNVLLGAILYRYSDTHDPLKGFTVRKQIKEYGMGQQIEGEVGLYPVLIDDVATTGGSFEHCFIHMPVRPKFSIVVVDREEGAAELCKDYGSQLISLLTRKDLGI